MQDGLYILATIGIFATMAALVLGCERIVGTDESGATPGGEPAPSAELAEELR